MSNFIKVGKHRLNLDLVSEIKEFGDGSVHIFWSYAVGGDCGVVSCAYDDLHGDEAKLLLAYVDGDDDEVDRLYPIVNGIK